MIKLYKGDCLEVMENIPDNSIDLILCDLPYGITNCKWDSLISFDKLWKQYHRIIKNNGVIALFSSQPFTTKLIYSNFKYFKYCWYWKKSNVTGGIFCKYQPMRCIEDICVFYKKMPTYNPQGIRELKQIKIKQPQETIQVYRKKKNPSIQTHTGYPKHILEFDNVPTNKRHHPTQKPVELLEYLIKTYTNPGEIVLDNCMGSGSTGIAALNTGRKFVGIELQDKYFNISCNRFGEWFLKDEVKENVC